MAAGWTGIDVRGDAISCSDRQPRAALTSFAVSCAIRSPYASRKASADPCGRHDRIDRMATQRCRRGQAAAESKRRESVTHRSAGVDEATPRQDVRETCYRMKLLLIGPASLGIAGGISVSFNHLRNSLLQRNAALIEVVDTVGIRQRKLLAPFALALFFWRVFLATHRSDIVTLHAMPTALPLHLLFHLGRSRSAAVAADIPSFRRRLSRRAHRPLPAPSCSLVHAPVERRPASDETADL